MIRNKNWSVVVFPLALVALLAACGAAVGVLSVQISGTDLRLASGTTAALTVDVQVTGGASEDVTWSSSNEAVATVSESGVVTAVRAGSATERAVSVADSSKSDAVSVEVLAAPTVDAPPAAGEATATLGGAPASVTTAIDAGSVSLSVAAVHVVVGLQDDNGDSLPVLPGGVPRVVENGSVTVSGTGYAPGTAVDVWLFSDPALLGSPLTDANGAFSGSFELPAGTPLGQHTLVLEGNEQSGELLSLQLGIEVQAGAQVLEFAHCPVGSGWFVSAVNGSDTNVGTSVGAPLATIQAAVDAAVTGDAVCVAAGTYSVDNSGVGSGGEDVVLVDVAKAIALYGPNVGVNGSAVRRPEAEVIVSSSESDDLYAFAVQASDVTIDGFSITTLTPKTDPYPDGVYGVWVGSDATQGVTIRNNVLVDTNFPIWVNRGRAAEGASGFLIADNLIEGPNAESDQGILVQGAFGDVSNNVVRDARVGIQVQPYTFVGSGTVTGNDFEVVQAGLWFNYQESPAASWAFEDNTVVGTPSPWGWPLYNSPDVNVWSGIRIETFYNGSVSFTGNEVSLGTANPPLQSYLLRQRTVTSGTVDGIGSTTELGSLFTDNSFPDFVGAVTVADLSVDAELIQLLAPLD